MKSGHCFAIIASTHMKGDAPMAGFIHNELDIKMTILYAASRLEGAVDFNTLADLALCDDGINYFQFAQYANALADNGLLSREGDRWAITDKGRETVVGFGDSLSVVIRERCDKRAAPVNEQLRRRAQFRSSVEEDPNGGCRLRLAFSDGADDLLTLTFWTPGEDTARRASDRFQRDPKLVYEGVVDVLLNGGKGACGT